MESIFGYIPTLNEQRTKFDSEALNSVRVNRQVKMNQFFNDLDFMTTNVKARDLITKLKENYIQECISEGSMSGVLHERRKR